MAAVQRVAVYASYATELHHKITVAGEIDETGSSQFFSPIWKTSDLLTSARGVKQLKSVNKQTNSHSAKSKTQRHNKPRVTFTERMLKDSACMMSLPGRPLRIM